MYLITSSVCKNQLSCEWRWPFDSHFTPQQRTINTVWTLCCKKQWYLILWRFRFQCCLMLSHVLLHWFHPFSAYCVWLSCKSKSETPHYTQNTHAHTITPSGCVILDCMIKYWPVSNAGNRIWCHDDVTINCFCCIKYYFIIYFFNKCEFQMTNNNNW